MKPIDENLSLSHLADLIITMQDWSRRQPWSRAQMAAWRLRWFGKTPREDARSRQKCREQLERERRRGFDRYAPREREPFID
jgi:hypothetical protein